MKNNVYASIAYLLWQMSRGVCSIKIEYFFQNKNNVVFVYPEHYLIFNINKIVLTQTKNRRFDLMLIEINSVGVTCLLLGQSTNPIVSIFIYFNCRENVNDHKTIWRNLYHHHHHDHLLFMQKKKNKSNETYHKHQLITIGKKIRRNNDVFFYQQRSYAKWRKMTWKI